MFDGYNFDGAKAYKDSKLCLMMTSNLLHDKYQKQNSQITVNAFGPGLITRTGTYFPITTFRLCDCPYETDTFGFIGPGFFRYQNPLFVKLFDFATNDIFHVAETVDGGGDCLVYMATSSDLEGKTGLYYNNGIAPGEGKTGHRFEVSSVSTEATNDAEAKTLWRYSEQFVGLA